MPCPVAYRRAHGPSKRDGADGAMERLEELSRRLEIQRGFATLSRAADPDDEQQALRRLHDRLRASKVSPSIPDAPHVGATAPVEGSK